MLSGELTSVDVVAHKLSALISRRVDTGEQVFNKFTYVN